MTTGLTAMFDFAVDFFAQQNWECIQEFGWRVVDHKIDERADYNRIYWTPGDNASAGVWGPARYPGQAPRSLGTLHEVCTVTICAYDYTQAEIERAQYEKTLLLAERWLNAMHSGSPTSKKIVNTRWLENQKLRSKGAALQIVWTIETIVPDLTANAGMETHAIQAPIAITMSSVTETVIATVARHVLTENTERVGLQTYEVDECVLAIAQADARENGLWQVSESAWTRSPIAIVHGLCVEVLGAGKWVVSTPDPIIVGTTEITFESVV